MKVSGRRREKSSDDHTKGIQCDPCRGVNEEENAVFYCAVCNEFLCDVDAKKHRKAFISKSHQLLDKNSMPRQKTESYEDNLCPIHAGEILEYYCNSHSKMICSVCATKEHKQCKIENIDDISNGYEKSTEYKSLLKDMTDLTRRLYSVKQQSLDNKSNAQHLHSDIITEIRKFREEINSILDSLEKASLKEARGIFHIDNDATESITTNCDTFLANFRVMKSSMRNLRKYKQEKQLVMHSKNAQAQVKNIEDKLSKLSDLNERKHYKFIPAKKIPQLLRSLNSLGRLEITKESMEPKQNEQIAKYVSGAEVLTPVVNQPITASHVRDINIQHSTDTHTRCYITGGVMIDQSRLVLVDRNNDSVKLVDVISDNVISCIKLPSGPWDITCP